MNQKLIFLLPVLFLVSCAQFSKKSCEGMDWQKYGAEDAAKGRFKNAKGRFDYIRSCSKFTDTAAFVKAYEDGAQPELKKICNASGGRLYSEKGYDAPTGICKRFGGEGEFLRAYTERSRLAEIKRRAEIARKDREMRPTRAAGTAPKSGAPVKPPTNNPPTKKSSAKKIK